LEKFIKGSVVVFPYPFSDLTSQKRRPALIVAVPGGNDVIVCQITGKKHSDKYSIKLESDDFLSGSLNLTSCIRPKNLK